MKTDSDLIRQVPAKVALHYHVLPLRYEKDVLKLLVPSNIGRNEKEELRVVLGCALEFEHAALDEIDERLQSTYGVGATAIESLTLKNSFSEEIHGFEVIDEDKESDLTVIGLVNQLLCDALSHRASDIHIEPFEHTLRIRYRVDGILIQAKVSEKIRHLALSLISRIKIMANLDIGEKRLPQDGRIKIKQKGRELDLRISVVPSSFGEAIVIRILKSLELLSLEQLGFDPATLEILRKDIRKPHGLILVTGPTGSGKTTTLYACLKELNEISRKIITIEDPIEYKLQGLIQMQVHEKIGYSFSKALRSILRHDPDSIMVGEIRDPETAAIAVRAALTGHLVFSTLHTNDAPSAVARLVDMGIEPYLVAASVELVLAQRLVRKKSKEPEKEFEGRTVLYEVMTMTELLKEMVLTHKPASALRVQALKEGMRSMRDCGLQKVQSGLTTSDEVHRVTS